LQLASGVRTRPAGAEAQGGSQWVSYIIARGGHYPLAAVLARRLTDNSLLTPSLAPL